MISKSLAAKFRAIDRNNNFYESPKHLRIRYIRQEKRYCFPAHMGNAMHRLVFGKVNKDDWEQEKRENALVLQLAANKAHDRKLGTR